MKNILEILKQFGIILPEDKLASFETMFAENYKTIADYNNQKAKLESSEDKVKTLTESLDKFKDVDPAALNQTIEDLRTQLTNKDTEFAQKMADRDFEDLLNRNITDFKGKSAKAIKAYLDIDTLKKSQNQEKDIKTVLEALSKAEDSAFLFGEAEPKPQGKLNIIGGINGNTQTTDYLDAVYKNNPYYKK